jgi:hypothetical protein
MKDADPLAPFAAGEASPDPKGEQATRELASRLPPGIRIDLATCFPQSGGWREKRANEARLDLIQKNAAVLERCLSGRDRVRYIVLVREQLWWEAFAAGQWAMLLNRNVLVATDEKLLIIHADGKGRPIHFVNQIPYGAIKKLSGFLATMTILTTKEKRVFNTQSAARKAIVPLVPIGPKEAATGGLEYLCPACFAPSPRHVEQCASCLAKFKSPGTAAMRSLFVPGLGTWYVGNKGFAALQLVRASLLWLFLLAIGLHALTSAKRDRGDAVLFLFLLVFVLLTHVMDSAISRAQAKKGLIATDGKVPSAATFSAR